MQKPMVLVVEDEAALVAMLRYNLEKQGFQVEEAVDGQEAIARITESPPDIVLLDWMLPVMSGIEVCRQIRRRPATRDLPVIMVTAQSEDQDAVRGLNTGADDYITSPFSPRELILRDKKMLQRGQATPQKADQMRFGDLAIDIPRHLVSIGGRKVELTATEFKLLTVLAQRRGRVQSREQLLQDVWEYDNLIDTRTVDTHMRRLRAKRGRGPKYPDTVRGVGYRVVEG